MIKSHKLYFTATNMECLKILKDPVKKYDKNMQQRHENIVYGFIRVNEL